MNMINYVVVLIAAVFNMVLGFVWYGPLFGKMWMKFNGYTKADMDKAMKKGDMNVKYGMMFVASLVLAYGMNWVMSMSGTTGLVNGAMLGAMLWFFFTLTVQFSSWLFSGKKFGALLVDSLYYLVS